jgi:hypothetical protein
MGAIVPHSFALRAFSQRLPWLTLEADLRYENQQSVDAQPIVWGIVRNMSCRRTDAK